MKPIRDYKSLPRDQTPPRFTEGFPLAVIIILVFFFLMLSIALFLLGKTTDYGNARVVYLAANARAMEFYASGHYRVPTQEDLISNTVASVLENANITIADEDMNGTVDYIVYTRDGRITKYMPGEQTVMIQE